jgi:hypothetical protein
MGDELEESQECLSGLAERSCMFLYCICIILAMYIFILYMNYTSYVYFYTVYALH